MADAPHITIDRRDNKLYVDGVEFPYLIAESGPQVEDIAATDTFPVVLIPIIASDIDVIPARDA